MPPHDAREKLRLTDGHLRVGQESVEEIFNNQEVRLFLHRLFLLSGLFGCLDLQGAWTLSVLPKTNGGRWFTLNIGSHEVAFSTRKPVQRKFSHFIVLDRLILDYPDTINWISNREGSVREAHYVAAERAVIVSFQEDFADAEKFFSLAGVRRALVAYWFDALADLRQRNAKSVFARYHSYNAVAKLLEYKRATENILSN